MSNLVGEKGQVVIQKSLREAPGIQPGFVEHIRSLRGALKKYAKRILSTGELQEAREKAWDEAVTVDWNREGRER